MNVSELLETIGQGPPAPVYLFCPGKPPYGKTQTFEPFLAERAVERMIATHVDPSMKDLCFSSFYADESEAGQIVLECQTYPFLAERRVVLVRHAERYELEATAKRMVAYLESPCETTVLLLVAAKADRRTKFFKACVKSGVVVECPELRGLELTRWVETEARARGKKITSAAVKELTDRAGTHLSDVNNALDVVCGFVGEATTVRDEDVRTACADVAEEEIWALTDAIAISDTGKALESLRNIIELGKSEIEIMGTINWLLKSAYAVASAGSGPSQIKPFVAKKVAPLAEKLGLVKLRAAFSLCLNAELMLRSTGVDRTLAVELLVVKLAAPRATRRPAQEIPR